MLIILNKEAGLNARFWNRTFLTLIGVSLVVFINLRWLLPDLYFRNKRALYFLISASLLLLVVWGIHSDLLPWNQQVEQGFNFHNEQLRPAERSSLSVQERNDNFRWLVRNLPPLFISLLGSSLVVVSRFAGEKEKETIRLEKAKLETEIKFLKSQINPHFLFNSLHNIYALTIIQPDQASEQLLKLSDILRYMLYDSNEEKVPLAREVVYLKNYLSLAELKDSRGMDLRFHIEGETSELMVAPLLFIPFVENAFKHSQIEDLKKGYIHISLKTQEKQLIFIVENSRPKHVYKKDQVGGIGLQNIQQRLILLYPEKHQLKIEEQEDTFKVHLTLNLS
jgi:signal transduction histidine kinase